MINGRQRASELAGLVLVSLGCSGPLLAEATPSTAGGIVFHDRNGNGRRDPNEEGLPGVCVSNQRDVVRTDTDGRYRLPVTEDSVLFVVKPRNWMTPVDEAKHLPRFYYIHKPAGSPPLEFGGVEPTGPLPDSVDFALYPRQEPDCFRVVLFGDTQSRNEREIEYLAHDVIAELVGTDAAFGITLGDLVHNDPSLFDRHNRTVGLIGIPWYNVIGNHDCNLDAPGDRHSDEAFEREYGPSYYSFNHGPVHFIVLDDIKWRGGAANKELGYHGEFGETQLEFVRNDLATVPHDGLVVLMMHIPLTSVKDRGVLFRLIEDHAHALSISSHTHAQDHLFLTDKHGWRGSRPHHHVVHAAVCGSWWRGAPDEFGIPHATMRDGTPNGYSIVTFERSEASFEFKVSRRPADYQMNIFAPYDVAADEAADAEVVVNVFGGSQRSMVEMRLGTEGPWRPMTRVARQDPGVVRLAKEEKKEPKPRGAPLGEPTLSSHIWQIKLPPNPPVGCDLIHVRTTDMYGHTYEGCRAIRIY